MILLDESTLPAVADRLARRYLRLTCQTAFQKFPENLQTAAQTASRDWWNLVSLDDPPAPDQVRQRLLTGLGQIDRTIQEWLDLQIGRLSHLDGLTPDFFIEELRALTQEFTRVEWEAEEESLNVQTETITLEDVSLGPFKVHLSTGCLGDRSPFIVEALEPSYGGGDSEHPHPHIKHNRLCEGDGASLIASALQAGRLSEFFLIVQQILQTYNEDSAYFLLRDWHTQGCSSCGGRLDPDEFDRCTRCGDDVCPDCGYSCESCSAILCHNCAERCASCSQSLCSDCSRTCDHCHKSQLCEECLHEHEQNTHDILDDEDPESDPDAEPESNPDEEEVEETPATTPLSADDLEADLHVPDSAPPVHTGGLGKVALPEGCRSD